MYANILQRGMTLKMETKWKKASLKKKTTHIMYASIYMKCPEQTNTENRWLPRACGLRERQDVDGTLGVTINGYKLFFSSDESIKLTT